MKEKKEMLMKLKKNLLATALSTTCLLTLAGCSKNNEEKIITDNAIYIENDFTDEYDEYTKVIDFREIDCEELSSHFIENGVPLSLMKITEEKISTTKELEDLKDENIDAMSTGFFNKYGVGNYIIWPSSLELYPTEGVYNSILNPELCEQEITVQNLDVLNSSVSLKYVTTSIEFKKTPKLVVKTLVDDRYYDYIEEGDSLESKALYYNDTLIAYEQTGLGSDSENIVSVGNIETAIKPVSDYTFDDYSIELKEVNQLQKKLNRNFNLNK